MLRVFAILLFGLFVSCTGGNNSQSGQTQEPREAADAGSSAESPVVATPTDEPSPAPEPTRVEADALEGLLLRLEDMPTGYSLAPQDDDEEDEPDECDSPLQAKLETSVSFQQSDFGPFISHFVGVFESELEAAASFKIASELLQRGCSSRTDSEGVTTTISIASFPTIGDESLAANVSATGGFLPVSERVVYFRKGSFTSLIAIVGAVTVDASPLEGLARKALGRLP